MALLHPHTAAAAAARRAGAHHLLHGQCPMILSPHAVSASAVSRRFASAPKTHYVRRKGQGCVEPVRRLSTSCRVLRLRDSVGAHVT